MIRIRGLHKSFAAVHVLRGVDLDVADGEVVALIGRSGCGKTTLLRCINFLEEYDAGEIRLDGQLLWYHPEVAGARRRLPESVIRRARQRMGVVFQQFNLFPHMTALENVCLGPLYSQLVPAAEAAAHGSALLARVGLADKVGAYPAFLSGGQQQRVAIARALAMKPKVLLLDEITSALDPELVAEVEDVILGLVDEGSAKKFFPNAQILTFDTPSGQFLAVKSGRAQALQIDTPTADYFAATSTNNFEVLPQLLTASQNNAIYLKPGDFRWWLWLDTFVSELRTGSYYPQYTEIYKKWFGKNPPPQKFYLQQ